MFNSFFPFSCLKVSPSDSDSLKIFYPDISAQFFLEATFQPWRSVGRVVPREESLAQRHGDRAHTDNENKPSVGSLMFLFPRGIFLVGGGQDGHRKKASDHLHPRQPFLVGVKFSLKCHNLLWQVIHWDKGWSSSIKQMSDKTPNAYKWLLCKQWNDWKAWPDDVLHVWTSLQKT